MGLHERRNFADLSVGLVDELTEGQSSGRDHSDFDADEGLRETLQLLRAENLGAGQ